MSPQRLGIKVDNGSQPECSRKRNITRRRKHMNGFRACHEKGDPCSHNLEEEEIFPAQSIWIIHVLTLVCRVAIAADRRNWWILHPDEVFQTVEIAHSEVYGYGFRPYEYLPPPEINTTHLPDQQRAVLGMYSLRSFLLPRIFMALFYVKEKIGIQTNPLLIGKVFHAIIAAHLPLTVYYFLRHIVKSRDIRILTAILVGTSEHLTVLGTHTLVNSMLAPFTFLSLGWFLNLNTSTTSPKVEANQHIALYHQEANGKLHGIGKDESLNGIPGAHVTFTDRSRTNNGFVNKSDSNGHGIPNSSLLLAGAAYPCTSWLNGCKMEELICTFQQMSNALPFLQKLSNGCLFGILVYIRIDLTLFVMVVILAFYAYDQLPDIRRLTARLVPFVLGGCTGLVIAGWEDYTSYGVWFISPFQWFRFNVYRDFSTAMFGQGNHLFYIEDIFLRDKYSIILLLIVLCAITISVFGRRFDLCTNHNDEPLVRLSATCVCLGSIYSAKGHKELRFVHNVIVVYYVIVAISLEILINSVCRLSKISHIKLLFYSCIVLASLSNSISGCRHFSDKDIARWAHLGSTDSGHVNDCLEFIGQQDDVTGVFIDRTIHMTGGYSVLHKDVPILALIHYEYYEFDKSARKKLPSQSGLNRLHSKEVEVSVISQVSDFFTVDNSPLLFKSIISQNIYNYALLGPNKIVLDVGFEQVFSTRILQVLRRKVHRQAHTDLQNVAKAIPIGTDATVLEFEGSWLYTFGLYHKSIIRLEEALRLDRDRVKVYQLLASSYGALGDVSLANQVFSQCVKLHGPKCSKPQPKVVLHSNLNINGNIQ